MSKKCVELEIDTDTGDITVAECEPKAEMMAGEEGGEPAGQTFQSIEEALQAAAKILTGDTQETEASAMASAQKGYGDKPRMMGGAAMGKKPSVGQVFGGA